MDCGYFMPGREVAPAAQLRALPSNSRKGLLAGQPPIQKFYRRLSFCCVITRLCSFFLLVMNPPVERYRSANDLESEIDVDLLLSVSARLVGSVYFYALYQFMHLPVVAHAMAGVRVAVAATVLHSAWRLAKGGVKDPLTALVFAAALVLLLVSAFVGGDWRTIYDYALSHDFRFLSYGDSSILTKH